MVFWALVEVRALGEGLQPLLSPPAAYGLLLALGFSERFLEGLTERLEEQVTEGKGAKGAGDQKEGVPQGPGVLARRGGGGG